ncbi:DUF2189 domain-containing protein [Erythrobacter rubeus]|uniref:DUF2189 domain-containing protein n=1 Tax=Erythrobacter rubeus TaxID=2760803 RepID=A0ABR8KU70_9SPHN|nr:DUF2189 domain-containing protein [Erythrobacter rubeus]MBD2841969.1 DUF2189 domain-containing protein [Erythrobacter rubeus]
MTTIDDPLDTPLPPAKITNDLAIGDLWAALSAGWKDFAAMPQYGIAIGGAYVITGLVLGYLAFVMGQTSVLIPAIAGFPLIAPFIAVGLYEASRRREEGEPLSWASVLGALKGKGDEQILSMGVIVFVAFAFWMIVAHSVSAIFMAEAGPGAESLAFLTTGMGIAMLVVGGGIGAVMAFAFYSMTVISLPMLVDKPVSFATAIIASFKTVQSNLAVMLVWAIIIAVLLFLAMIPAFLGLIVILPLLGHATWHLYRRALG